MARMFAFSIIVWLIIDNQSSENGCDLIDTFRYLHPTERNVYTCFCNQFGGRQTNFGSRIDYILCESKLKSLVKSASVLTTMKGSDHLPVITGEYKSHYLFNRVGLFSSLFTTLSRTKDSCSESTQN